MTVHPRPRLLYAASLFAVWSAFWLCIALAGMIAALAFRSGYVSAVALPAFLLGMLLFFPMALALRCPACRRRVLIQPIKAVYSEAADWVSVAWKIVRKRQFTCMHCGTQCAVKPNQAMQLTASKSVVYASGVCRRASMLRFMHRGLAAADLVAR